MNIDKFISKKEVLLKNKFKDSVHIALCFDENYALPAGVLLTSILENNVHNNFTVHLFVQSIKESDIIKFNIIQC